jgi:hypothetical protein
VVISPHMRVRPSYSQGMLLLFIACWLLIWHLQFTPFTSTLRNYISDPSQRQGVGGVVWDCHTNLNKRVLNADVLQLSEERVVQKPLTTWRDGIRNVMSCNTGKWIVTRTGIYIDLVHTVEYEKNTIRLSWHIITIVGSCDLSRNVRVI